MISYRRFVVQIMMRTLWFPRVRASGRLLNEPRPRVPGEKIEGSMPPVFPGTVPASGEDGLARV